MPQCQPCPFIAAHGQLPDKVTHSRDHLQEINAFEGQSQDLSQFDRFIIYTDGSSRAHNRGQPPLRVQDEDVPDAWVFVVLGERYGVHHRL